MGPVRVVGVICGTIQHNVVSKYPTDVSRPIKSQQTPCNNSIVLLCGLLQASDREPVYNPHLGLAVEQLPTGATVEQLWSVL